MPEVLIKYQKPETLKVLKSLGKYLGFVVSPKETVGKEISITIIPGDKAIDIEELSAIFTTNNTNAAQLRNAAWQRKR